MNLDAALDRRLDCASDRPLAVAFSGGGDSLALLMLAKAWAARAGRRVLALTVDHGIDPRSAAWTAQAGAVARRLGVDWQGLVWRGEKPATGLQAAARRARHALLADAARAAGGRAILFGHTADDVREASLIRRETPAIGRLRAWSPSPAWPQGRGVFLLRPLLDARRADLRAWLSGQGLEWFDDPANADPRFARSRARAALARDASELDRLRLIRHHPELVEGEGRCTVADRLVLRQAQDEAISCERTLNRPALTSCADLDAGALEAVTIEDLARPCLATPDGRLVCSRSTLSDAGDGAVRHFLSAALVCASGRERPPRGAAIERLLERLRGEGAFTVSLAGARVVATPDALELGREAGEGARGGLQPVRLDPGPAAVFDGRFEVEVDQPGFTVAALAGRAARLDAASVRRLRDLAPAARRALPVLIDPKGRASLPAPLGDGPGHVRALAGARLAGACGLITRETEIGEAIGLMAQDGGSSYVQPLEIG